MEEKAGEERCDLTDCRGGGGFLRRSWSRSRSHLTEVRVRRCETESALASAEPRRTRGMTSLLAVVT